MIPCLKDLSSITFCNALCRFIRSEELKFEYKEFKKGQPLKELRLGNPGSFGVVFAALHCGSPVAVKKLKSPTGVDDLISSDAARASFSAFVLEVSFASSLHHPNIVRTLGGVVDPSEDFPCWIVMERLERTLLEANLLTQKLIFFDFLTQHSDPPRSRAKACP